ncbi:MAG: 30S ribosomal protein S28e [Candidatus Micrarchaeia archaeon]
MANEAYPAKIVEIKTKTGSCGEIYQVLCKVLEGPDTGKILTRNVKGPVKEDMIIMLLDTEREAREIKSR